MLNDAKAYDDLKKKIENIADKIGRDKLQPETDDPRDLLNAIDYYLQDAGLEEYEQMYD